MSSYYQTWRTVSTRPSGAMDSALDFESRGCGFESHLGFTEDLCILQRGRTIFLEYFCSVIFYGAKVARLPVNTGIRTQVYRFKVCCADQLHHIDMPTDVPGDFRRTIGYIIPVLCLPRFPHLHLMAVVLFKKRNQNKIVGLSHCCCV